MATSDEAQQAIIDLIVDAANEKPDSGGPKDRNAIHNMQAEVILKLAEAFAWLRSPSHGN